MKYRDITFFDFIYAIRDKYKSMLVIAVIVTLLGGSFSAFYVYNKEHDYQNSNIEIGVIEEIGNEVADEEVEKIVQVVNKYNQLNAYITAITPYTSENQTEILIASMEKLNQNIMMYEYTIKFGREVEPVEIASIKDLPEIMHNIILRYIQENLVDINIVIEEINVIITDVQLVGDNITAERNIKIHDESKILSGDTYVYSYFTEKLDVHSTIIAYITFFALTGIASGYIYGIIKFIEQNRRGTHTLKK